MVIREQLIQNNRPRRAITSTSVTIHNTGNPDTTAQNNRDYFSNHPNAQASAHYVVDDREAIRCIPENEEAWHAGPVANKSSIGIEVCEFTDPARQARADENAAALVADILSRYGWGVDRIKTHRDWTGKNCPRKLLPMWAQFIGMVNAAMPKSPLEVALEKLKAAGVISDVAYWVKNAVPGGTCKGDNVAVLLTKLAARL